MWGDTRSERATMVCTSPHSASVMAMSGMVIGEDQGLPSLTEGCAGRNQRLMELAETLMLLTPA